MPEPGCRRACLAAGLAAGACLLASFAAAGEVRLVPFLRVTAEHTDNVAFDRVVSESDFVATLTPGFRYQDSSERSIVRAEAAADFVRYAEHRELDDVRQRYQFSAERRMGEYFGGSVGGTYREDSTLETEPGVTGVVIATSRRTYGPNAAASFQLNERSQLALSYAFRRTTYTSDRYVDVDSHAAQVTLERVIDEKGSKLFLQPQYAYYASALNRVHNYGAAVGWSPKMTETLSFSIAAGAQYTTIDFRGVLAAAGRGREIGRSFLLNSTGEWKGETSSVEVAVSRNASYNARGDAVETDTATLGLRRSFTERSSGTLSGSYRRSRGLGSSREEDTAYWDVMPSFRWRFAEHHDLTLFYTHAWSIDRRLIDHQTATRNRFWATAHFSFPKQW